MLGVLPALIDLADLGHPQIRQICSAAMHTLPTEATDKCSDKRLIKILMTMLHADAEKLAVSPPHHRTPAQGSSHLATSPLCQG